MRTIPRPTQSRNTIRRTATYKGVRGTAQLLNSTGYVFWRDGATEALLVSYKDQELVLGGYVLPNSGGGFVLPPKES